MTGAFGSSAFARAFTNTSFMANPYYYAASTYPYNSYGMTPNLSATNTTNPIVSNANLNSIIGNPNIKSENVLGGSQASSSLIGLGANAFGAGTGFGV